MKFNARRALIALIVAVFFPGGFVAFGADSTNSILRLHFQTNSLGETLVQHGEKISSITNAQNILNASQLATNRGAQISLIPEDSSVSITSQQFPDWIAEVPPRQSLLFSFDHPRRAIDLQTSDLNLDTIELKFPDGATVSMSGHADGRFELMDDGTYLFLGYGPITGQNADGAPIRLGNVFPPLFGGRLIAPPPNNPNARFTRAAPVTQLTLVGQIETGVTARVGASVLLLEPGVARDVRVENGAEISLVVNPTTRTVDWEVRRGVFRVSVEDFRCWRALGTSGQAASMQWSPDGALMEIKNRNGKDAFQGSVLVNLNPTLNVAVGPSATFQYGRTTDCSTFVATAYGGETTMYNSQLDNFVRLDQGNINILAGSASGLPRESPPNFKPVRLGWSTPEKAEVKSGNESIVVLDNGHEIFKPDEGTELDLTLASEKFHLRVESGAVSVTPDFMPTIAVEISEGSAVTFAYQRGADILQVEPDARNLGTIAIRTATGFYPRVTPGTRLTFVINRSTFTAGDEASLIFTETAGAGASISLNAIQVRSLPTGRGQAPLLGGPNPDGPRIDQPPVTTLE